ncbi:MAG: four helix bundle protein [Anaerolineaceae bacterium]
MTNNTPQSQTDPIVWQKSLEFSKRILDLAQNLKTTRPNFRLFEQIETAATSIAKNAAIGQEQESPEAKIQILTSIRESIMEIMTIVGIFKLRNWIDEASNNQIRTHALELTELVQKKDKTS